jgi:hypothetical protein
VKGCRRALILFALLVVVAATVTVASTSEAQAATLRSRFIAARHALHIAKVRLSRAEANLTAALAAQTASTTPPPAGATTADPTAIPTPSPSTSPTPSLAASPTPSPTPTTTTAQQLASLKAAVARDRQRVKTCAKVVRSLARQVRLQRLMALWARRGQWRPLIKVIAARYHVSAAGLYRMMMLESGGRRFACSGGGLFLGLFQYYPGTWRAPWNPWRHCSIFDGKAQICATALAVHRGMAGHMWPNTYRMAF